MIMGPSVISGGTSIASKVLPLVWGNDVPGPIGDDRIGTAVRCPSHHIAQFSTPLPGEVDPLPATVLVGIIWVGWV